jgi:flagellar L-ring protein precursor FlgH
MKRYIQILILLAFFGAQPLMAQFIQNSSRSLFSDVKAFQAGDAIMVLIVEDTQADNESTIASERGTELSFGLDAQAGASGASVDGGIETGNNFSGRGRTSRSESIRSRLSARVVEVVDNGNLSIEGTRTTKINGEEQTIEIKGIVRPVDVLPNNSVYSYNILDLTLKIEGEGTVTETQEPGLITKFLRLLF